MFYRREDSAQNSYHEAIGAIFLGLSWICGIVILCSKETALIGIWVLALIDERTDCCSKEIAMIWIWILRSDGIVGCYPVSEGDGTGGGAAVERAPLPRQASAGHQKSVAKSHLCVLVRIGTVL